MLALMYFPKITAMAIAVLGLIFVVLAVLVVAARGQSKVTMGDGAETAPNLYIAIRSHANFAEFVPTALFLLATLETITGPTLEIKILAYGLVAARIAHPIGMRMAGTNPFRAFGFAGTLIVILTASVELLRHCG